MIGGIGAFPHFLLTAGGVQTNRNVNTDYFVGGTKKSSIFCWKQKNLTGIRIA